MTMNTVRTLLFAFPVAILAQNPAAEVGWLPSITQGGAFAALVFVLWWILTRQQPAEKAAYVKTIEAIISDNAAARALYADQSEKCRQQFSAETLVLRQAFSEELKNYRHEGKNRQQDAATALLIKDEQIIAILQGKSPPSFSEHRPTERST